MFLMFMSTVNYLLLIRSLGVSVIWIGSVCYCYRVQVSLIWTLHQRNLNFMTVTRNLSRSQKPTNNDSNTVRICAQWNIQEINANCKTWIWNVGD